MLFLDPLADLAVCLDSEISSIKKSSLEEPTVIRIVTARLLITEKRSEIFLLERLSTKDHRI